MAQVAQKQRRSSLGQRRNPLALFVRRFLAAKHTDASSWKRATAAVAAPSTILNTASTVHSRANIRARMPPGAWDSHVHVFDAVRYPLPPASLYTPPHCMADDLLAFETTLGVSNVVLVQPSCYGNDNACMLAAMKALGPRRARGVVAFDVATTTAAQLRAYHMLGVRGVRINLQSVGQTLDAAGLRATLHQYAAAVRPLGWVVQVYVPLPLVVLLEAIVPDLGVRVCIDHLGHPDLSPAYRASRDPYDLEGFSSLITLLQAGRTYTKMSGAYRFAQQRDEYEDVRPIVQEILRVGGRDRVVFASDWPHTRFDRLDITSWTEKVMAWCADEAMVNAVFRNTARDLWGVEDDV